MDVRLAISVRIQPDEFGAIVYVGHRDDFFAVDKNVFAVIKALSSVWSKVPPLAENTFVALAKLGICETREPVTVEDAYSGPSFIGRFVEIPTVTEPLVLNCFCTSYCPLKCKYCHADDLMVPYRATETERDIDNVVATAVSIPALVAVITGGDPLSRPDRAAYLIERLAVQKALVLDTSGVGDIRSLLPVLKQHRVHVRVSLDSISPENDKLRPPNPEFVRGADISRRGAEEAIRLCLEENIAVTVQSVVTSQNENLSEWRLLQEALVQWGVRHWVLHVAVKGGSARRIENEARKQQRPRGIVPSQRVYDLLKILVRETQESGLPLDVRCTDTGNTPNSVLLIGSTGDLFTEGYAHNGKVLLYSAGAGRPDLVRALWPHLDRFGHARRYLNWNPWFYAGESLEDLCYEVPIELVKADAPSSLVETEVKYRVVDRDIMDSLLQSQGFERSDPVLQRDEYFDTALRELTPVDYVLRIRTEGEESQLGFKGPRFYSSHGEYSRIEFEIDPRRDAREQLEKRGYVIKWVLEKKRSEYRSSQSSLKVSLDEVPEIGFFLEVEGTGSEIRNFVNTIRSGLGNQETKNYAELFVQFKTAAGVSSSSVMGATFSSTSKK